MLVVYCQARKDKFFTRNSKLEIIFILHTHSSADIECKFRLLNTFSVCGNKLKIHYAFMLDNIKFKYEEYHANLAI